MIKGKWELSITEPTFYDYGLTNNCGHEIPDRTITSYKAMQHSFKVFRSLLFELKEDGNIDSESEFQ